MRCFVAIYPDIRLLVQLRDLRHQLRKQLPDDEIRWIQEDALHLTLAFCAEIEDEQAERVWNILQPRLARQSPFDIRLTEIGPFPARRPLVVALGLERPPALQTLDLTIQAALEEVGLPRSTRPLEPHITLARVRGKANPRSRRLLQGLDRLPLRGSLHVKEIRMVQSHLTATGAQHTPLHVIPLGGNSVDKTTA